MAVEMHTYEEFKSYGFVELPPEKEGGSARFCSEQREGTMLRVT